jgi:hypothetical protein
MGNQKQDRLKTHIVIYKPPSDECALQVRAIPLAHRRSELDKNKLATSSACAAKQPPDEGKSGLLNRLCHTRINIHLFSNRKIEKNSRIFQTMLEKQIW